jgi:preprotein translocase SecE subunit
MARDRQRAKQRRRRSGGAGGSARPRARDARQADPRETPPTDVPEPDPSAPPEPTEHAFPDVEEARLAEAGVPLDDDASGDDGARIYADEVYGDDEVEPAPDELDPGSAYADEPAAVEERAGARPRRKRGKILTFLGHVVDELRRVQWPDRRQTAQGTAVTLGFVVVAGGFLGLMDAIWKPLVEAIL